MAQNIALYNCYGTKQNKRLILSIDYDNKQTKFIVAWWSDYEGRDSGSKCFADNQFREAKEYYDRIQTNETYWY